MAHIKPILAVTSVGLGAALLLTAAHIQRDPFAFTSQEAQGDDALSGVHLVAPAPVLESETIFEAPLAAEPGTHEAPPAAEPALRPRKPAVNRKSVTPAERAQPPCNPEWRELEGGPVGSKVRELCPSAGVPQS